MHASSSSSSTYDPTEVAKFSFDSWWDLTGPVKTLHQLNPARLQYIQQHVSLAGKTVLDVGCGGGILAEAMARTGARVTGIDANPLAIEVAKQHAEAEGVILSYQAIQIEQFADQASMQFDVITCLELLEHVPDFSAFIKQLCPLVKPGGKVFFSTLDRTPKAYLYAVLAAEYMLKLLPKGTHDYHKFIRPAELRAACAQAELELVDIQGLSYNPFNGTATLGKHQGVNYLCCCQA